MSSADITTATTIVRNVADKLGTTLDPGTRSTIAAEIAASIRLDATGRAIALDQHGNPLVVVKDGAAVDAGPEGLIDLVREAIQRHGTKPAASAPSASAKPDNLTERMRQSRANQGKDLADGITGNPWRRETFNLSQQMVISKNDPDRAARLRAEAGVRR